VRSLEWQMAGVVSLAPRQIDRGDNDGLAGRRQEQGSAEAVPVGRKSKMVALFLTSIIPQFFPLQQKRQEKLKRERSSL